jgi:hypothetical protein
MFVDGIPLLLIVVLAATTRMPAERSNRGAALWRCADVAAGCYLLSIFDATNTLLSSTEVIKQ